VLTARVSKDWPGAKEPGQPHGGGPGRRKMMPPGVPSASGARDERAGDRLRAAGVLLAASCVLPLLVGQTEHKVMAHMQGRLGPMYAGGYHGWAQLVADGAKFVQKEDIVPAAADKRLFHARPRLALIPYLVALAAIPIHPGFAVADLPVGRCSCWRRPASAFSGRWWRGGRAPTSTP
jgi:hypothetical protein